MPSFDDLAAKYKSLRLNSTAQSIPISSGWQRKTRFHIFSLPICLQHMRSHQGMKNVYELGYLPMNRKGMFNLFQLINAIYEYKSVILTTNKNFTNWGDFFL